MVLTRVPIFYIFANNMAPLKLVFCFLSFLIYFGLDCVSSAEYGVNGFGVDFQYGPSQCRCGPSQCRCGPSQCRCEQLRPCGENVIVTRLTDPVKTLGDAPFYDEDCNSVYFVDGIQPAIYRYDITEKKVYSVKIGTPQLNDDNVSVIIPIKGEPGKFLIAYNDVFCILFWDGVSTRASFEVIEKPDPCDPFPQFIINDVKVAPNDALFFDIVPTFTPPDIRTSVRRRSTLFGIKNRKQKVLIPRQDYGNGLGWSYDGNWFYHSDSIQNLTFKSFYNQITNTIEFTQVLFDYAKLGIPGHPDSLTTDKAGFLWIAAQQGGARVLKVDPNTGEVVCAVKLPAKSVTNVAIGRGPNGAFDCIYVTTSRSIFDASPGPTTINDGALFSIQGTGSEGVLAKKVDLGKIFNKKCFS